MSQVTQTSTSPLRGTALRTAVMRAITEMAGRRDYSAAGLATEWSGRNRIILSTPSRLASGYVDITDGNPSRIEVLVDLRGLASGMAGQLRTDLARVAQQLRSSTAAAPSSEPAAETRPERRRREVDVAEVTAGFDMFAQLAELAEAAAAQVTAQFGPDAPPEEGRPATSTAPRLKTTTWRTAETYRTKADVEADAARERARSIMRWGTLGLVGLAVVGGMALVARGREAA